MNNLALSLTSGYPNDFLRETVDFIKNIQSADGAIAWYKGRHIDPWNHVEAAMGLSIGGELEAAEHAYEWLFSKQLDNGTWWESYSNSGKDTLCVQSHFVAYVATGMWHHYLISQNENFLDRLWPMAEKALDCVVCNCSADGHIGWTIDASGKTAGDALLSGSSSINRSLDCAIRIATTLGYTKPHWVIARDKIASRLRYPESGFLDKSRYAMDWFYPILSGALSIKEMNERIDHHWDDFVITGLGCLCVRDEPWIAVAESCELIIALCCINEQSRAEKIYRQLHRWRLEDGGYWTGYQHKLDIPWPEEKTTWTAGAVVLAYDALFGYSAASDMFLLPATAQ